MKIINGMRRPTLEAEAKPYCPCCGMARSKWKENDGHGFWGGAEVYCCRGCVEGTGCTCLD